MSWRYQEERCYFSNISNISIVSVLDVPSFIFTGCCLVAGCCVSIASLFAVIVEFLHALCNCWICFLLPWMIAGGFVLQPHSWLGVLDHNLSPWPCKTRCHMFCVVAPVSECAEQPSVNCKCVSVEARWCCSEIATKVTCELPGCSPDSIHIHQTYRSCQTCEEACWPSLGPVKPLTPQPLTLSGLELSRNVFENSFSLGEILGECVCLFDD